MILSPYAVNLLRGSTCYHVVAVVDSAAGRQLWAIYNGLSYWARIEAPGGELVEMVYCCDPNPNCCIGMFDLRAAGYEPLAPV